MEGVKTDSFPELVREAKLTTGKELSMTIFLLAPSEPFAPGVGRVRNAFASPFELVIVAPFSYFEIEAEESSLDNTG